MAKNKRRQRARIIVVVLILIIVLIFVAVTVLPLFIHNGAGTGGVKSAGFFDILQGNTYTPLSKDEITDIMDDTAPKLDDKKKTVLEAAVSLVGKVHYFWGGKSTAKKWDDNWGEMRTVDSDGSDSSGTERPYGLDCSGYVAWCFSQLGMNKTAVDREIGLGTWKQWEQSAEIDWDELQPGDLVFQNEPSKDNHVGICIGYNEKKQPLFAHCASGFDNVVVTTKGEIFKYARRPAMFQ